MDDLTEDLNRLGWMHGIELDERQRQAVRELIEHRVRIATEDLEDERRFAWQPIETAPSACHVIATRFDECEWIYNVVSSPPTKPFTHWQPLPAPPDRLEQ